MKKKYIHCFARRKSKNDEYKLWLCILILGKTKNRWLRKEGKEVREYETVSDDADDDDNDEM